MARYDGKPFLRLLDCYVLQSIGELGESQATTLAQMEPKLRQVYGMDGSWSEIVAKQMAFPSNLPDEIRRIWSNGQQKAQSMGLVANPLEFTEQFVDTNFPT